MAGKYNVIKFLKKIVFELLLGNMGGREVKLGKRKIVYLLSYMSDTTTSLVY